MIDYMLLHKARWYQKDFVPYQNTVTYFLLNKLKWHMIPDNDGNLGGIQVIPWRLIIPKGIFKSTYFYQVKGRDIEEKRGLFIISDDARINAEPGESMTYYNNEDFQIVSCSGSDGDYWIANNVSFLPQDQGMSSGGEYIVKTIKIKKECCNAIWRPGWVDTYENYLSNTKLVSDYSYDYTGRRLKDIFGASYDY